MCVLTVEKSPLILTPTAAALVIFDSCVSPRQNVWSAENNYGDRGRYAVNIVGGSPFVHLDLRQDGALVSVKTVASELKDVDGALLVNAKLNEMDGYQTRPERVPPIPCGRGVGFRTKRATFFSVAPMGFTLWNIVSLWQKSLAVLWRLGKLSITRTASEMTTALRTWSFGMGAMVKGLL